MSATEVGGRRRTSAAVLEVAGRPLLLREFALPTPGAGEVLIDVLACTLCASDLHTFTGRRGAAGPLVPGHEVVGRIAALGADPPLSVSGASLRVGDRVTWAVAVACGRCRACVHGAPEHCTERFKYGHAPVERAPLSGGLACHVLLLARTAIAHVPSEVSDAAAAPMMCAGATAMAALRRGSVAESDRVLIVGAGLLGLSAAAGARAAGAREVVIADPSTVRRPLGAAFGATSAVADVSDTARGFDLVIEASGSTEATAAAIDRLAIGGRLVCVGAVLPVEKLEVDPEQLVRGRLTLAGVHNYLPEDLQVALKTLAPYSDALDGLVDPPLSLEEFVEGGHAFREPRGSRACVRPT